MPARTLLSELQLRFNADELRQLAALRLDADAGTIFGDRATTNDAALQLVEWARRHGRLCDLARSAAAERPQSETLAAVARLMPLVCGDDGRRGDVGTPPPVEVERRAQVTDPGIEYGNGVQRTLGRVESQIDALRSDVAGMRQELAAQRADSEQRAVTQRVHLWLTLLAVAGTLGTAAALVTHMWP